MRNHQKPYAVDIDDVIGALSVVMNPVLNARFNKQIGIDQWTSFSLSSLYGISLKDFLDCIIEERLLERMPVIPGAVSALRSLKETGADVVLITSRGYHPSATDVTRNWLEEISAPYDDLIIVPEGMSKGEIAKSRYPGGFGAMFDDYANNLDSMKEHGLVRKTVLINKPWNQSRDDYRHGINRFDSLQDYVEHQRRQVMDRVTINECALM